MCVSLGLWCQSHKLDDWIVVPCCQQTQVVISQHLPNEICYKSDMIYRTSWKWYFCFHLMQIQLQVELQHDQFGNMHQLMADRQMTALRCFDPLEPPRIMTFVYLYLKFNNRMKSLMVCEEYNELCISLVAQRKYEHLLALLLEIHIQ